MGLVDFNSKTKLIKMKISYKVLQKYIPDIKSPEELAQDLVMHTAEVEDIHSE